MRARFAFSLFIQALPHGIGVAQPGHRGFHERLAHRAIPSPRNAGFQRDIALGFLGISAARRASGSGAAFFSPALGLFSTRRGSRSRSAPSRSPWRQWRASPYDLRKITEITNFDKSADNRPPAARHRGPRHALLVLCRRRLRMVLYYLAFQSGHALWRSGWTVGPRYITPLVSASPPSRSRSPCNSSPPPRARSAPAFLPARSSRCRRDRREPASPHRSCRGFPDEPCRARFRRSGPAAPLARLGPAQSAPARRSAWTLERVADFSCARDRRCALPPPPVAEASTQRLSSWISSKSRKHLRRPRRTLRSAAFSPASGRCPDLLGRTVFERIESHVSAGSWPSALPFSPRASWIPSATTSTANPSPTAIAMRILNGSSPQGAPLLQFSDAI